MVKALFALQHAGLEGRLRITFELFDTARSGRIHEQELYEILKVRLLAVLCCSVAGIPAMFCVYISVRLRARNTAVAHTPCLTLCHRGG